MPTYCEQVANQSVIQRVATLSTIRQVHMFLTPQHSTIPTPTAMRLWLLHGVVSAVLVEMCGNCECVAKGGQTSLHGVVCPLVFLTRDISYD